MNKNLTLNTQIWKTKEEVHKNKWISNFRIRITKKMKSKWKKRKTTTSMNRHSTLVLSGCMGSTYRFRIQSSFCKRVTPRHPIKSSFTHWTIRSFCTTTKSTFKNTTFTIKIPFQRLKFPKTRIISQVLITGRILKFNFRKSTSGESRTENQSWSGKTCKKEKSIN